MAQNQKDEIQNLSEEDDTPEIINYIKTQRIKKVLNIKIILTKAKIKVHQLIVLFMGRKKRIFQIHQ